MPGCRLPDRWKYRALREAVPYADAERALDVGCGTGRSLVGLAPAVPDTCRLVGLDVFDNRVILGNGPALARRNAAVAGLEANRVLSPDGTLGVPELPIPHDSEAAPLDYWEGLVADAGFTVEEAREVEAGGYFLIVASPE